MKRQLSIRNDITNYGRTTALRILCWPCRFNCARLSFAVELLGRIKSNQEHICEKKEILLLQYSAGILIRSFFFIKFEFLSYLISS